MDYQDEHTASRDLLDILVNSIKEYIDANQDVGYCRCIILARNCARSNSHKAIGWDFYVIHDREPVVIGTSQYQHKLLRHKGQRVDLFCVTQGLAITHSRGRKNRDRVGLHMLAEGEVKFCREDYEDQICELRKKASERLKHLSSTL